MIYWVYNMNVYSMGSLSYAGREKHKRLGGGKRRFSFFSSDVPNNCSRFFSGTFQRCSETSPVTKIFGHVKTQGIASTERDDSAVFGVVRSIQFLELDR